MIDLHKYMFACVHTQTTRRKVITFMVTTIAFNTQKAHSPTFSTIGYRNCANTIQVNCQAEKWHAWRNTVCVWRRVRHDDGLWSTRGGGQGEESKADWWIPLFFCLSSEPGQWSSSGRGERKCFSRVPLSPESSYRCVYASSLCMAIMWTKFRVVHPK